MGIGTRIGIIAANIAILIPVFTVLIASAVMSSMVAVKIKKLTDQNISVKKALKYATRSTIALWILSVGSILFSFTIGIPYLYGVIMIIFAIINLVIAGIFFYTCIVIRKSTDYKNNTENAKSAYKYSLIIGLMLLCAAIFMIGYAVWSINKYIKGGGLSGDLALAAKIAPIVMTGGISAIPEVIGGAVLEGG